MVHKVFFQSGPNSRLAGWGDFVQEAARRGIPVAGAVTDSRAVYDDIVKYGSSGSQVNWRPTEGPTQEEMQTIDPNWVWGRYKIDNPDYNHYPSYNAAMASYRRGASFHIDATILMCNKAGVNIAHPFVAISTWNEIRKEAGWADSTPIPGFTGWADVAGTQATLIGEELIKRKREGSLHFRWAAFAFAGGCPDLDAWETPGMLAYLHLAGANPDVLGIALHEYSFVQDIWDGFEGMEKIGRVLHLNNVCKRRGIPLPWVHIKELGWGERKVPPYAKAVEDVEGLAAFYATVPNVQLGALWTVNGGWTPASDVVPALAPDVYRLALNSTPAPTTTTTLPTPPPTNRTVTVNLIAQGATLPYSQEVLAQVYAKRQTITYSEDDAKVLMASGNEGSSIVYWKGDEEPAPPFLYSHWPTNTKKINQAFGANPAVYNKYGLPGHEGVDLTAGTGSPICAPADGVVVSVHLNPSDGHAYGIYVRIKHGETGYETTLAHNLSLGVRVGDEVVGGQLIALADSTGNSTGSHCHLTLKSNRAGEGGQEYIGYPYNIIDPTPFLSHLLADTPPLYSATVTGVTSGLRLRAEPNTSSAVLDVMPAGTIVPVYQEQGSWRMVKYNGTTVGWCWSSYLTKLGTPSYDLTEYMIGDGRLYEVRHPSGATETFQTQRDGTQFFYVKNAQWEQLWYDNDYIWRGYDTSPGSAPAGSERPGAARFYRQFETEKDGARWAKRHMELGETWRGSGHMVQFYYKSDCEKSAVNSGNATNVLKLVAYHRAKTFNGLVINDVLEVSTATGESMYFAKGFGLVAWQAAWGSSAISEIHQGRPNLKREVVKCL